MALSELNKPLVSVVVPCFNRALMLPDTLDSILQQDYHHIECIVVDGGSSDGTLEVLERYQGRVKWISEPDHGQADAINKGWKMSSGEILAWLNADDLWVVPDAVSRVVGYFLANPEVDLAYGDCGRVDVEGKAIGMSYLHEWDLEYAVTHSDHCIPQPAAFIRRQVLERVGSLDTRFVIMDKDLWFRIGLVGTIRHFPTLLAYARYHPSFWHSKSYLVAADCVQIAEKFFDNPELPTKLRANRARAISNAYLRGMEYAMIGRHWSTLFLYALRAVLADPMNAGAARRRFRWLLSDKVKERRWLIGPLLALDLMSFPWRLIGKLRSLGMHFRPKPGSTGGH